MTVEDARLVYGYWAQWQRTVLRHHLKDGRDVATCTPCHWTDRRIEAASIVLDLAVAEASRARTRAQVAWA